MACMSEHPISVWKLAGRQQGIVAREQLLARGFSRSAIEHRLRNGRLHRLWPGVYAVGSPHVSRLGRWMAAVLACGEGAVLSHESAAALWGMQAPREGEIHVSVPLGRPRRLRGIRAHRRRNLRPADVTRRHGIPVTTPAATLVDIAPGLSGAELEEAVSQADARNVIDAEVLRRALDEIPPRPGLGRLKGTLDRRTFRLTRSRLERLFLPIAARAGLGAPQTRQWVNGFEVDFFWPDLGLVVETDGLRYHRTPSQQAKDRVRDQAHLAAGMTPIRFTYAQIRFERAHVHETLAAVARRLRES
jgi:very-short-patch-repair endonuclease